MRTYTVESLSLKMIALSVAVAVSVSACGSSRTGGVSVSADGLDADAATTDVAPASNEWRDLDVTYRELRFETGVAIYENTWRLSFRSPTSWDIVAIGGETFVDHLADGTRIVLHVPVGATRSFEDGIFRAVNPDEPPAEGVYEERTGEVIAVNRWLQPRYETWSRSDDTGSGVLASRVQGSTSAQTYLAAIGEMSDIPLLFIESDKGTPTFAAEVLSLRVSGQEVSLPASTPLDDSVLSATK